MEKKNKMKKIFKNLFIFSLICVFSSCEFFTDSFNAPVKDFFMDNTEAASIGLFEFSSETYKNPITEKLTVSSLQDANVVLYLRNPQKYNFITSENMTSTFGSFLQSEYSLVQDENDKNIINLTIPKELLEKTEIESRNNEYNKSQNILINLFHPVSKAEFLPFTLEFDCDTVPPKILSPVFYNTNSSYIDTSKQNNYVIAFNMPKKSEVCSLGVHNDLEKLLIDETEYEVSIADDGTISFPNNPEVVSGNVEDATGIEAIKARFFVQDDYQPFYFVTNKQISIEGAKATLSLVDKGNFSSKIDVSSNARMLGKVLLKANDTVFTPETEVIEVNQEVNESYANITIIPPSVSVDLDGNEEAVSDVYVNYTLTNIDTNEVVTGSNNGSDSVTIDVPIGTYKLECISHKDYYADSVTTFGQINIQNIQIVYIYVSVDGNDSDFGTFFAPVKTIQKAVDKVIAMNKVTASSEENPYKILLLSDIETSSNDSFENNKALVNIDPSSASGNPLYLTISKYGDGNATINAKRTESDTGRVMYIGENANVTLQNLILTGGYLEDKNGAGVYLAGGTFTMNGGAVISSDNDVYLADGTTITVTGNLTSTDTVATITPSEYSPSRQVLEADSGVTLSNSLVKQFRVTPAEGDKEWFVDSYGYLGKVPETEKNDEGTDVYLMESYDNLLYIAQGLKTGSITSLNMKLTNNIDIPSGKWQFSELNAPDYSTIDGQGYSITIKEDVSKFGNSAGGLFYKFNRSTVKNLVLKGSITANTRIIVNTTNNTTEVGYIGALCRSAWRTTIQNVMSTVEIIDEGSGNAGGLVGRFGGHNGDERTPDAFIKNCAVYADISSKDGTAGGLVGESWENTQTWKIENCIYMGTVSSETGVAGALIGNENTGRTSYLTNIWYCESNNCAIFGKEGNKGSITQSKVKSKTAEEIDTAEAATLLNTNSDGTVNDVWKYTDGSKYPTLKTRSSE